MTGNSQLAPAFRRLPPHHTSAWEFNDQILTNHCLARVHGKWLESQRRQGWKGSQSPLSMSQIGDQWGRHKESHRLVQMIHDSYLHSGRVNGSACVFGAAERPVGEEQLQASLGWNRRFYALENVCNLLHSCLSFVEQRGDNTAVSEHVNQGHYGRYVVQIWRHLHESFSDHMEVVCLRVKNGK